MGNFKHKYEQCSYWRGEQNESKKKNITATGQHCLADCGVQYYSNWNTQLYWACDSCEYFALSAGFCCILVDVFYKLVIRHTDRIQNYEDELQFFWHFFDKKSFLIMAFMMTFGIGLRASHFAPDVFIAVFYSGLGMALFLAGVLFGVHYFQQERKVSR